MILRYTAEKSDSGEKILTILKKKLFCSGTQIRRLKSNNMIFLNGTPTFTNIRVDEGDEVTIKIIEHRINDNVPAQDIPIEILFEDEYIVALDKPAGMVVHPSGIYTSGTLSNALRHHYLKKGTDMTSRPIGRLDRNTSGVVVFAKNSHVMARLSNIYGSPDTIKLYHGIVHNRPESDEGVIDLPITRSPDSIISRITSKDGKPSKTEYRLLEEFDGFSLIEYRLLTGRTHQIRLHTSEIGCPLLGDGIYGDETLGKDLMKRHALHCMSLVFRNPFTDETVGINAPYPEDFTIALEKLRK